MDQLIQDFHERLAALSARAACPVCGADDWYARVSSRPTGNLGGWEKIMPLDLKLGTILRVCRRCGARHEFTALLPTETA